MIKILFASRFSEEELMKFPSNFSYYVKEMRESSECNLFFINPDKFQGNYIKRMVAMAKEINSIKPDILYLTLWMGYNNLILAKILGLIKCKIAIWKYTECIDSRNIVKHWFYKYIYWKSIDRVYMMYENHTDDALARGLLKPSQVITLSRGTDIKWYSKFLNDKEQSEFVVIATGKDSRDYYTLGKACEETKTYCKIITFPHDSCVKAAEELEECKYVSFEFVKDGYLIDTYKHITEEVAKSSVLAICCEKRPYGVGYTNIVESLAFRIPIIQTLNPDVHLDPEKCRIGFSVKPYDIDEWKEKIVKLKSDPLLVEEFKRNIQALLDSEYDSKVTTSFLISDFKQLLKK